MTEDRQLINDLDAAIRERIDTYCHGHEIPIVLIVGILQALVIEYGMELIRFDGGGDGDGDGGSDGEGDDE